MELNQDLDAAISSLISEENITKARKLSDKKMESLTTDQYKYLRKRAKLDLFFLCTAILGYNKLSAKLHGELCWWLMRNWKQRFKEILLPRSHYKSTIVTIGHSIQIPLPDESGIAPWPENLGTNVRLLIGHETAEQASRFLVSIAGHFLSNPLLMGLFPECVPTAKKQRINKYELELPRSEIWNEATYDTMGVGGKSQGKHYDYLKLDDLIGDKARDSKAEMQTAKDWFDNIQAFFTEFLKAKFDLVGTRWAYEDLYNHAHITYGPSLLKYIRAAEELNEATGELEPIFPEAFTTESFAILKKNPKIWSAQYANDPAAGANELLPQWKRYYEWAGYNKLRYAVGESWMYHNIMNLDRVILIDPATVGKSGFIVTGSASDEKIFILEATKNDWRPPELVDYIFKAVVRWQPRLVAIEDVLFSAIFKPWLESEMKLRGIRFIVVPIKTGGKAKDARVRGLTNYWAAGCIYHHITQVDFEEEFNKFGATEDYHMLDALAQGPQVWTKPYTQERWDSFKQAEQILLAERDAETGY
jgi:hypothetical protein